MNRLLWIAVVAGCTEPEPPVSLAELGALDLDFEWGMNFLEVTINHGQAPCPMLGDDFHAFVAHEPAAPWPGGWYEATYCTAQDGLPCMPASETRCTLPSLYILTSGLPSYHPVVLFGDHSRTVECQLGDELVPRQLTLISPASWTAIAPGKRVTVQWFPAADLARFPIAVELAHSEYDFDKRSLDVSIEGDQISFDIPDPLDRGAYYLGIGAANAVPTTAACDGIPNHGSFYRWFDQHFHVL